MSETYAFGEFRLDVDARTVSFGGAPVKLTAKSIAVLTQLARRAPGVVSRAEFEAAVWPEGFIEASNLTQTIYMIRTTLARFDRSPIIDTHNGQGYRLAVPVRLVADQIQTQRAQPSLPAIGRIATSVALGFGIACASAFVATRDVPPESPTVTHTIAHAVGGGLSRRANAAPIP